MFAVQAKSHGKWAAKLSCRCHSVLAKSDCRRTPLKHKSYLDITCIESTLYRSVRRVVSHRAS